MIKKSIFIGLFCCNVLSAYGLEVPDAVAISAESVAPKLKSVKDTTPQPLPFTVTRTSNLEALYFSEVNLTQVRLHNGMTIWLKPTKFDHDEIYVIATALGGYASLSNDDRPSGELAASIAWESGLGELSADQVTVLFHDNNLEFSPKIYPFKRTIEGGVGEASRLGAFFQCIKMVFTQQRFNEAGFKEALAKAKGSISKVSNDIENLYETEFLKVNTQGVKALQPLNAPDLEKVDFNKAKNFYKSSFYDPSEFAVIVVGDIDVEKVIELANRYLGQIPRQRAPSNFTQSMSQMFPPGITKVAVKMPRRTDTVSRITFPWKKTMSERKFFKMAITCQIIKARLKNVITDKFKQSFGIDVAYEFPFYPFLDNPWITIRFRSDNDKLELINKLILSELQKLQDKGVDEEELDQIKVLEAGRDEFRLGDNFYWSSMLANYYLWDWDPQWIYRSSKLTQEISLEKVNWILKSAFSMENYSTVTAVPESN